VTIMARDYITLFWGTTLIGIANGMVEAACNPLVATLYPNQKTKMLNRFHVWFPGGIVIGGVLGYLIMDIMSLSWMILAGTLLIPLLIYGVLFFNAQFPKTERVTTGVSYNDMIKKCFQPLFIFMLLCMMLTAATELGTTQRIEALLGQSLEAPILILVFINGLMALGRLYAGEIVMLRLVSTSQYKWSYDIFFRCCLCTWCLLFLAYDAIFCCGKNTSNWSIRFVSYGWCWYAICVDRTSSDR